METKYYHKNSKVVAYSKNTKNGYSSESTYDERGNQLTFKNSDGYSCEYTYDEKGNQLTFKDSIGCWREKTYDERSNLLTYKNSDGISWEKTYDERGNKLTYKNSNCIFKIKGQYVTKEEFDAFINNRNRPCVGKKVIVDGIEYELK